jgi:hypothetical protein
MFSITMKPDDIVWVGSGAALVLQAAHRDARGEPVASVAIITRPSDMDTFAARRLLVPRGGEFEAGGALFHVSEINLENRSPARAVVRFGVDAPRSLRVCHTKRLAGADAPALDLTITATTRGA